MLNRGLYAVRCEVDSVFDKNGPRRSTMRYSHVLRPRRNWLVFTAQRAASDARFCAAKGRFNRSESTGTAQAHLP